MVAYRANMGGDPTQTDADRDRVPEWWRPYGGEFPDWHAWRGVSGLYYAKLRRSSPPVIVRGEDPQDLCDEVRRADAKRPNSGWWR